MDVLIRYAPGLLQGIHTTLLLGVINVAVSIAIGLLLVTCIRSGRQWLKHIVIVLMEFIRGNAIIVLLFWTFYALPLLPGGIQLSGFTCAVLSMSLLGGVYAAEIFRAAAQAVARGQYDACAALGIGFWRREIRIVLPQALPIALPSLGGLSVEIFKWTSVASLVTVPDLMFWGEAARLDTGETVIIYACLLVIYLAIAASVRFLFWIIRRRVDFDGPGSGGRRITNDVVGLPVNVRS